ncbi:MAG: hypothetical protein EOP02_02890 [Proteobacteria bacterium]|nr:MAG: hypothetical protein EOP02_02890 [Pseudomonadota bacterium]
MLGSHAQPTFNDVLHQDATRTVLQSGRIAVLLYRWRLFYGFNDLTSACAFSAACIADPSAAFFWDGVHPTASVHALIGQEALALAVIPLPGTALLLALGLSVLALARNRRAGPSCNW